METAAGACGCADHRAADHQGDARPTASRRCCSWPWVIRSTVIRCRSTSTLWPSSSPTLTRPWSPSAIAAISAQLFMTADQFRTMMTARTMAASANPLNQPTAAQWLRVYAILTAAETKKRLYPQWAAQEETARRPDVLDGAQGQAAAVAGQRRPAQPVACRPRPAQPAADHRPRPDRPGRHGQPGHRPIPPSACGRPATAGCSRRPPCRSRPASPTWTPPCRPRSAYPATTWRPSPS